MAASTSGTKFSDNDDLREFLHEQREELTAAQPIETDIDYADSLQLNDSLTASVAAAASSSQFPVHFLKTSGESNESQPSMAASTSGTKFSDHDDLRELLHEQREELTAAQLIEKDLDYAYSLQLKEALTASVSAAASSSSLPSATASFSQYSPSEDARFLIDEEVDADDVRVLMKLMEEDVERLEQEMADRELSEAEARRVREDLHRRLHDRRVAAEILAIPEEEWARTGDEFQKPYGEGLGFSGYGMVMDDEKFSVYVKGVVSEERVKEAVVTVAGIGVAICDSRDYSIFEMRKPVVDGDGSVMTAERVGFEALVEGLKAVNDLGLKRVSCFCDEFMIHQSVSTKQLSTDFKVTMLAFEVLTLRKNLLHFDITLVGRNEMRNAFELAREAIVSQISLPINTKAGKKIIETCVICLEDTVVSDMFTIEGCLHRYCFSCMKQHVEVKLLNGKMAHCPDVACKSEVPLESCKSFLDAKFVDIMISRLREAALPPAEKVYCPYPRCSSLMSKNEIVRNSTNYLNDPKLVGMSKCTRCTKLFCRNCMVPWHHHETCEQYQSSKAYHGAGDGKLKSLATQKKWRQCVKCSNMIELAEGCYHIYCRCG